MARGCGAAFHEQGPCHVGVVDVAQEGLRLAVDRGHLLIPAEVVGACGVASPNACATFSPTDPLAMTMPAGGDIQAAGYAQFI